MQLSKLALTGIGMLLAQTAAAEIDWNITGAGARAEGMAGAFTGVADDATSIVWNPAGLATLIRPEASLVMRSIGNTVDYDWSSDLNSLGVEDEEESDSHALINFLSYVHPFEWQGRRLVAGVALQSQLDGYSDERVRSGYVVNGTELIDSDKSEGSVSTLTPGIGVQLSPVLSMGLAANVWTGTIDGDIVEHSDDGTNIYELEYAYEYKASGVNFNLGFLLDFSLAENPLPLKVGLNVRTPFELELDYSDNRDPILFWTSGTITVDMPLMIGLGASWRAGEFLTLALDVETRQYGGSKINSKFEDPTGLTAEQDAPLADHEEDLLQIRVGGEYLLVTDFAVIPLRFGVRTVPTLDADVEETATDLSFDQVTGFGYAVGSGLIFERMAFDLAFSSSNYENTFSVAGSEWLASTNTVNKLTLSGIFYF